MYTKADCEAIRTELNAALEELGKRHHTKLETGNIRYSQAELSITVKGMLISNPDIPPEQELFNRLAPAYGIPVGAYGKTVTISGHIFTVCGINPSARKNFVLLNENGKTYSCSSVTLNEALTKKK